MGLLRAIQRHKLLSFSIAAASGVAIYTQTRRKDWSSVGTVRFGRAMFGVAGIVVDYKKTLFHVDDSTEQYKELKSQVHWRSAEKLRQMCCKNGGIFVKIGQYLGSLDYLLPEEYVKTMKVLHNDAPRSPLDSIRRVVEEDLGCKVEDVFQEFSCEPIGTASLAQVHKASLKDGTQVAVKVQHPQVKAYSDVDMKTVDFLLHAVAWVFPEFEFLWLSEEMKKKLPVELDFIQEGHNAEKIARLLGHFKFLKVPKVYWNHSSARVLIMEYCEGGFVEDKAYMKKHGINVNKITQALGELYSEMIFVHGFVHCDPHPGNILIRKTDKQEMEMILLDHGLYQTLTDEFRWNYSHLWLALIRADLDNIKQYGQALGAGELYPLFACMLTARSWNSVTTGIDKVTPNQAEDQEIQESVGNYLPEISSILNKVPRQMLLLFKTNDLLRGIEFALDSRKSASSFINMSRCCVRAVADQDLSRCTSWISRTRVHLYKHLRLVGISAYQLYVQISNMSFMQHIIRLFSTAPVKQVSVVGL
ncbi:aarF domain-containing protein kinase 1-like [Amphiura filiformis]|uniref:aarF domain-containing protein kinase 1-like n=1 Tax=Amphiura filiformis TaxID=82378 RepID=UPI003B220E52